MLRRVIQFGAIRRIGYAFEGGKAGAGECHISNVSGLAAESSPTKGPPQEMLEQCKRMIEGKKFSEFKEAIHRDFVCSSANANDIDMFLWLFIRDAFKSKGLPINVPQAFDMYLQLAFPEIAEAEVNALTKENRKKIHFHKSTLFNLLSLACQDFELQRLNKKVEKVVKEAHIYMKMLNLVEKYDSKENKRQFHGAVLLTNGKNTVYNRVLHLTMSSCHAAGRDLIGLLCIEAAMKKDATLLEIIVKKPGLLQDMPNKDEMMADVFNVLALLYGQSRNNRKLVQLCRSLASLNPQNLSVFRNAMMRMAYFCRLNYVRQPMELGNMFIKIKSNYL